MPNAPFNCNRCGGQVSWPENWQQGQKPINADGTVHTCSGGGQQPTPTQGNPPQTVTPEVTPTTVLGEIAAFKEANKELDAAHFETVGKIYISRMMSRR